MESRSVGLIKFPAALFKSNGTYPTIIVEQSGSGPGFEVIGPTNISGKVDVDGGSNIGINVVSTALPIRAVNPGAQGYAAEFINNANYSPTGKFTNNCNGNGVNGTSNGNGNGVSGVCNGDGGNGGYFTAGMNNLTGNALKAVANAFCRAASFIGDVDITGTLSKTAGTFKIDHPLDPANKYLYHSFVESPDMMNVYNGNVILDNKGEAVVELPYYFENINMEFRYQLTCIGGFAQVYIAEKISDNKFSIAGGKAGLEVSWLVTGIRNDPYAQAHRIQVEVDKPDKEKGKYLYPELYGQGEEKGTHYEDKMKIMNSRKK